MARSRGVRSAGSTLQYAATKDNDDSESVLRSFKGLTISSVADGRIVSLSELRQAAARLVRAGRN